MNFPGEGPNLFVDRVHNKEFLYQPNKRRLLPAKIMVTLSGYRPYILQQDLILLLNTD